MTQAEPDEVGEDRKSRSKLGWFVRRYGWRAYALPFLIAATVFTIVDITHDTAPASAVGVTGGASGSESASGSAPVSTTVAPASTAAAANGATSTADQAPASASTASTDPGLGATVADPAIQIPANLAPGALPAGGSFTVTGDGSYRIVPNPGPQIGTSDTVKTYTIEIENGVSPVGGDDAFAAFVDGTLSDPRSWAAVKGISLKRLAAGGGEPDFRITLTSQLSERGICGYDVQLESSCFNGDVGRVVLNDARWVRGALSYAGDMTAYRHYAVNHEVGHALGYGHQPCGTDGGLAPVMMQQSWSTSDDALAAINGSVSADGKTCLPNPWPEPQNGEGQATGPTG